MEAAGSRRMRLRDAARAWRRTKFIFRLETKRLDCFLVPLARFLSHFPCLPMDRSTNLDIEELKR